MIADDQKLKLLLCKNRRHLPGLVIGLILWVCLLSGCVGGNRTQSTRLYENPESGVSLEVPTNWDVEFYERNGLILLEAESGFLQRNSARLEIGGNACAFDTWADRPDEWLVTDIERIKNLYHLSSVRIIQEPTEVELGGNEAARASIAISVSAMFDDTSRIQVSDRGPDALQTIDIYVITNQGGVIAAYIYKGDDEALNEQALEIIDSLQFICTPEP